jgi:hypothetical protein
LQGTSNITDAAIQVVPLTESESPFSWLRHHHSLPGEGEKCSSLALKEFFFFGRRRVNINCFSKRWRLPRHTRVLRYKEGYFKSLASVAEGNFVWWLLGWGEEEECDVPDLKPFKGALLEHPPVLAFRICSFCPLVSFLCVLLLE